MNFWLFRKKSKEKDTVEDIPKPCINCGNLTIFGDYCGGDCKRAYIRSHGHPYYVNDMVGDDPSYFKKSPDEKELYIDGDGFPRMIVNGWPTRIIQIA